MRASWCIDWLLLMLIKSTTFNVEAAWPALSSSTIQILGIFDNVASTTESSNTYNQSRAMFRAAILLSQQYHMMFDGQYLYWNLEDTDSNVINTLSKSCLAFTRSNIIGIIGPGRSREAHLMADFSKTIGIPIISPSVTDPNLSDFNTYPNFYRIMPSDNSTAFAMVKLFNRFNWTSCVLIYQNDAFGSGAAKQIDEAFNDNNLQIERTIIFDINTRRIRGDLKTYLINSATRIVILWVQANYIPIVLHKALESDVMGPLFTWILCSSISLNSFDKGYRNKLIGLLSIEPATASMVNASINATLLKAAVKIWKQYEPETYPGKSKIDTHALFTFDAVWSLILSLEQICTALNKKSASCLSFTGSLYCFDRQYVYTDLLLNSVSSTDFLGVSGPMKFKSNVTDRIIGSYFSLRSAQYLSNGLNFVPIFQYSDSTDWTMVQGTGVIAWNSDSFEVPSGRATLKRMPLRIGMIESVPFTMINSINATDKSKRFVGYIPDLIMHLENKIGFISDIQLIPSNTKYSDLIQAVEDGTYDIVVGDVTVTATRRQSVDFSNAIFDNALRIVVRKTPDIDVDLLSFFNTFSPTLWLLVLGAFIYAGVLICLVERNYNQVLKGRTILSQLGLSIWYAFGNIIGYGADFQVCTAPGRLITTGLYMLCLILVATFTANLTSDLTISKSKGIISGIDDIKKGKIPFSRVGIRDGTASEDYFVREISSESRLFYLAHSQNELYDRLLDGSIDAIVIDAGVAEYITNNLFCNLCIVGDGFDQGVYGIVTPKEWIYGKDLDVNILLLREAGVLEELRKKWFQINNCSHSYIKSTSTSIDSMKGLFLIFTVITLLAILVFVWSNRFTVKDYVLKFWGCVKSWLHKSKSFEKPLV